LDSHVKEAPLLQLSVKGSDRHGCAVAAQQEVRQQECQEVSRVGEPYAVVDPAAVVVKPDDAAAADISNRLIMS
jgi:hypothetical protein